MKKLNKQGFTLIEVVLVLAIGGLIFLLAFIAFQQVSANRRDTQRRSDAGRIVAEVQNYMANGGKMTDFGFGSTPASSPMDACNQNDPTAFMKLMKTQMCSSNGTVFTAPGGSSNYRVVSLIDAANKTTDNYPTNTNDIIFVIVNCDGIGGKFSVRIKLEKGTVCRDS